MQAQRRHTFLSPASVTPLFFHILYEPVYIVNSPADMLKFIQDITLFYFYFQNPLFDLLKIALFGNLIHEDTSCPSFYLFFAGRAIMNLKKKPDKKPAFLNFQSQEECSASVHKQIP